MTPHVPSPYDRYDRDSSALFDLSARLTELAELGRAQPHVIALDYYRLADTLQTMADAARAFARVYAPTL